MISSVTSKGQVTIPKAIRDRFSIHPHDKIDFTTEDDQIILKPVKTLRDLRGCVAGHGDLVTERQTAKGGVGKRVVDEMS